MTGAVPNHVPSEWVEVDEVVATDERMVEIAYEQLGIDHMLHAYASRTHPDIGLDIEHALLQYGQAIADLADSGEMIDVSLVRHGFETLYDGMEAAAGALLGPVKPRNIGQAALIRLGVRQPQQRQHFRRLNDNYWKREFMAEYQDESWDKRLPEEDEHHFLARYIGGTLQRWPWAYFSLIRS